MAEVLSKQKLAKDTFLLAIKDPLLAKYSHAGQFVLLQIDKKSKPHPYLIAGKNSKGISIVFRSDDKQLKNLRKGMSFNQVRGPLGTPVPVGELGTVCIVADHEGIGPALFIAEQFAAHKNRVFFIGSFSSKDHVYWQDRIEKTAHKFMILESKYDPVGNVLVREVHNIIRRKNIAMLVSAADIKTMEELAQITKLRTKHYALITPHTFDGIGMCGSCRVEVGGETKFACIDGPALDAHKLNWEIIKNRSNNFLEGCSKRCAK